MNTERLFKTVMMDLSSSQAKLEDKLETTINSDLDLDKKSELIKTILIDLTHVEMAMAKFSSMIMSNNDNLKPNTEKNGNEQV